MTAAGSTSALCRARGLLRNAAPAMTALVLLSACGGGHKTPPVAAAPRLDTLPQVALDAADLAGAYKVQSETYLTPDGQAVSQPTNQFRRVLQLQPGAPDAGPANVILVTLNNAGVDPASDFIDSAQDNDTGPPNLEDYIASTVAGSSNVHATPVDDFPSEDDGSAANRLTWDETVNGATSAVQAYGVYVRQGGLLAFVAVRAMDTGGGEPPGLRKQAEDVVKKQAAKLKQATLAQSTAGK